MFWVGSLMSQVLQWTQFCALIWSRSVAVAVFHEFVHAADSSGFRTAYLAD